MLLEPHGGQEDVKGRGARRNLGTAQPRETGSLPKAPQEGTGLGESQSRRGQIPPTAGAELRCAGRRKAEQSRGEREWGWGGVGFLEVT